VKSNYFVEDLYKIKKPQEVHLQYNQHENKNYKRVKVTTLAS
jgi:hypothetical protein